MNKIAFEEKYPIVINRCGAMLTVFFTFFYKL